MAPYLVSIIVSTFKSERFIDGCIKDLMHQTMFSKLEIIVIDSASPENEGAIVRRYQKTNPNIVYLRTKNRETLYQAWNRGIKMAKGKYITNANTDDRLRPDAYEIMSQVLEDNENIALVYTDYFITPFENQTFKNHIRSGYCRRPDYSPSIMLAGCHMGPQPMWRKSIHDIIGYFNESYRSAGDYEFWCRIGTHFPMKHIPLFLGLYLHNSSGIANSNLKLSHVETNRIKIAFADKYPPPISFHYEEIYYKKPCSPKEYVNIGMITFNRLNFTKQSIDSLLRYTDYPYVLTVVDNNSNDGTQEYLLDLNGKGIIKNLILLQSNIGVAKASNIAWLLEPNAGYYLKIDNDIIIQKHQWLQNMVNTIKKVKKLGMIGYSFEPVSYPETRINGCNIRIKDQGTLGGACVLIPLRTRKRLGYWSEKYGLYGEEDGDYGWRILFSGKKNAYMADEAIGYHLPAGRASIIDPKTLEAKDGIEEMLHKEYREWKDLLRKKNVETGYYNETIRKYRKSQKSLFHHPYHALEYIKKHYHEIYEQNRSGRYRFLRQLWKNLYLKTGLMRLMNDSKPSPNIFKESFLAHNYLNGLHGIEIGGSAHNPFGLNTLNIDYCATYTNFKDKELEMCGTILPVDIVARGDQLPFMNASFDFVLSSHVLEHFPDPIRSLKEWCRVIRPNGYIFMIIPHKDRTFDKERERTTLAELIERHKTGFDSKEPIHHSVWITEDIIELIRYLGLKIIEVQDVDDKVGNGFTLVIRNATSI